MEFDEKKEELEVFRSSYGKLKKTVGKLERYASSVAALCGDVLFLLSLSAEVDLANKFDTAERDLSEASEKLESCARQLENFQKKKESYVSAAWVEAKESLQAAASSLIPRMRHRQNWSCSVRRNWKQRPFEN